MEFEKRLEKLEEDKKKLKTADIANKGETTERASYTSEEYKSWLSDRRLQSKLHKEKSEMFSRTGTRPISGRDRAKIALSESRQKVAHSHLSHLPSKLELVIVCLINRFIFSKSFQIEILCDKFVQQT